METVKTLWHSEVGEAPLPPEVDGLPLARGQDSMEFFLEHYHRLGPIFRVNVLGRRFTVLAGRPANLFVSQAGSDYLTTSDFWREFDSQVGSQNPRDGADHSRMRKIKRRGYARSMVVNRLPEMVAMTRASLRAYQPGDAIPVVYLLRQIVADQLGLFLNRRLPGEYFDDLLLYMHTLIKSTLTRQLPASALAAPEFLLAKARVAELGRQVLAAHRADPDHEPDLIDDLLAAAARGEPQLAGDLSRAPLGPFTAGLDTVANTCAFELYALLTNPAPLGRLLLEADSALAQTPLCPQTLEAMPAWHGAALETLRRYPVAPMLMFAARQAFVFAGYRVEAAESVTVATTVTHFLPALFPHPYTFDLDRYSEPRSEHKQSGAFAPFGLGTHTCLGAGIAEIQAMLIPAVLLHAAEFALEPAGYVLHIRHDPTLTPGDEFQLRLVRWRQ